MKNKMKGLKPEELFKFIGGLNEQNRNPKKNNAPQEFKIGDKLVRKEENRQENGWISLCNDWNIQLDEILCVKSISTYIPSGKPHSYGLITSKGIFIGTFISQDFMLVGSKK